MNRTIFSRGDATLCLGDARWVVHRGVFQTACSKTIGEVTHIPTDCVLPEDVDDFVAFVYCQQEVLRTSPPAPNELREPCLGQLCRRYVRLSRLFDYFDAVSGVWRMLDLQWSHESWGMSLATLLPMTPSDFNDLVDVFWHHRLKLPLTWGFYKGVRRSFAPIRRLPPRLEGTEHRKWLPRKTKQAVLAELRFRRHHAGRHIDYERAKAGLQPAWDVLMQDNEFILNRMAGSGTFVQFWKRHCRVARSTTNPHKVIVAANGGMCIGPGGLVTPVVLEPPLEELEFMHDALLGWSQMRDDDGHLDVVIASLSCSLLSSYFLRSEYLSHFFEMHPTLDSMISIKMWNL